jgi:hypothetical protein
MNIPAIMKVSCLGPHWCSMREDLLVSAGEASAVVHSNCAILTHDHFFLPSLFSFAKEPPMR